MEPEENLKVWGLLQTFRVFESIFYQAAEMDTVIASGIWAIKSQQAKEKRQELDSCMLHISQMSQLNQVKLVACSPNVKKTQKQQNKNPTNPQKNKTILRVNAIYYIPQLAFNQKLLDMQRNKDLVPIHQTWRHHIPHNIM